MASKASDKCTILTDSEVRNRAAKCAFADLDFITLKPLDHKGETSPRCGPAFHGVAGVVMLNKYN
ncbi:MAG TPA: hypothetical protein VK141_05160 [Nitrosomonas sp.]|nr:hypothetical protein [Nitrosomonas sp.]